VSTRIAFLRAINLGARRKFAQADIVAATQAAGFTDVATHINTGNVRFETSMRSRARIEAALEAAYLADRGFEVPTITFTPAELAAVAADGARLAADRPGLARHYVHLLKEELAPRAAALVEASSTDQHTAVVSGRAVHAMLGEPYEAGAVDPLRLEKHLGTTTNRNLRVVTAIVQKWC